MAASRINSLCEAVFISPSVLYGRYFDCDLGIAYIQALLKQRGLRSAQITLVHRTDLYSFAEDALKRSPLMIGLLCTDRTYYLVKSIARAIKEVSPETAVVALGQMLAPADFLIMRNSPHIDMCVRGEGEEAVYEIISSFKGLLPLEQIKGLTYRKTGGALTRNPDRELAGARRAKGSELDVLPSPYLSGILTGVEGAGILSSRGCTFGCTYCLSSAAVNHTVRYHSVDRVISEIRQICRATGKTAGVNARKPLVKFLDRDFSSNLARAKEICRRLLKEKPGLEFFCELRADRVDDELLELLAAAGFREVNMGLESAVPRVLRKIKKVCGSSSRGNLYPERKYIKKFGENVRRARKFGLDPSVNVMLGLPGESFADGLKTMDFVSGLGVGLYYHHRLSLFPGTELFKTYKRYGIRDARHYDALPYGIKYQYDVNSIPYASNAAQFIPLCKETRYFTDIVFGCPWQKTESRILAGNKGFAFLVFRNFSKPDKGLFAWVKEIMAINAYVLFVTPRKMDRKFLFGTLDLASSAGLPTKEYHFMSYSDDGLGVYFRANPRPVSALPSSFKMVPLSKIPGLRQEKEGGGIQTIVTLENRNDIVTLASLLGGGGLNPASPLFDRLIDLNVSFLDGCRWLKKECFASGACKCIIDNGRITLCTHSGEIGRVGEPYGKIARDLKRRFEEEKDRRNCSRCPSRDACSKCLFTHPFSPEEYCRMRRNRPEINAVMGLISELRDFQLRRYLVEYAEGKPGKGEGNEN